MSFMQWRSILVAVADPFADDQPALSKAAAIARRCGATLNVFNAFMLPQVMQVATYHSSEEVLAAAIGQRQDRLKKLAGKLRLNGGVTFTVRWDYPPHEAIVRQILQHKPDLLVTDSHRHRRLARLVLANTDWELIRSCPCPLWFVRSAQLARRPNVLVAVDPSHAHAKPARLDGMLLSVAQGLVEQLGGNVDVLHAHETPATLLPPALLETLRLPVSAHKARDATEEAARAVHKLVDSHAVKVSNCHVKEGTVSDVIEAAVRRLKTEVLVMGAVSRSRLGTPIIGGTAERVIDHVDCDVLVVKPAGFKTAVTRKSPSLPRSHGGDERAAAA
jgi:universal stress protein E